MVREISPVGNKNNFIREFDIFIGDFSSILRLESETGSTSMKTVLCEVLGPLKECSEGTLILSRIDLIRKILGEVVGISCSSLHLDDQVLGGLTINKELEAD